MKVLDWPALMHAGFQYLALRPAEFWQLSPAELMQLLGAGAEAEPIGRDRIEELVPQFPDKDTDKRVAN